MINSVNRVKFTDLGKLQYKLVNVTLIALPDENTLNPNVHGRQRDEF